MKKRWLLLIGALILFAMFRIYGQDPKAQLTFHVTDESGRAIPKAPVSMTTSVGWRPGGNEYGHTLKRNVTGLSDKNGYAMLRLPCKIDSLYYSVFVPLANRKSMDIIPIEGQLYYLNQGVEFHFTNVVYGKWHPWNPTIEIVLKRVIKPIPMFARNFCNSRPPLEIPEFDKAVGFDLVKGDWVKPAGKGETADFLITLSVSDRGQRKIDRGQIFDATFSISFVNEGDGIQEFFSNPSKGSALLSPHCAPESGYTNVLIATSYEHEIGSGPEKREDQNYFFRVRTKRDEKGISGLYGKIYGNFQFDWRRRIGFTYYLNPTPNDQNLEFDPEKNLFTNLEWTQGVRAP